MQSLIRSTLKVYGFLELFCGACGLTLVVMVTSVPCILPWDVRYGQEFDIVAHRMLFLTMIRSQLIRALHFGTPCQSQTFARWPQLRSWSHLRGLQGLSQAQQALVDLGNQLADVTVELCLALHAVSS